jgi:alkylhydroperoxidase family enzyme
MVKLVKDARTGFDNRNLRAPSADRAVDNPKCPPGARGRQDALRVRAIQRVDDKVAALEYAPAVFFGEKRRTAVTETPALTFKTRDAAMSALFRPITVSSDKSCRFKFVTSKTSPSTTVRRLPRRGQAAR